MKKVITGTISLLEIKERRQLYAFILLDLIIIIADIASLVLLLFILNFYTQPSYTPPIAPYLPAVLTDRNSVLLIAFFLLFFSGKNIIAFTIHRLRFQFFYKIASRIAEKNLLQYLEGNYSTYVMVDSAVQIRKISQEPIEFSHYVLAGIMQIISQSILVGIAIITILVYNASLFLLLLIILLPPILLIVKLAKKEPETQGPRQKKAVKIHCSF